MMYLVAFTLNPLRPMPEVELEFRDQTAGRGWWHYLDNVWILVTEETSEQLWNRLRVRFRNTDSILIFEITANAEQQGWVALEGITWLNNTVQFRRRP